MAESYEAVELKEFQTHLYPRMSEFRLKNHLCDVNISVNGKLHPCHRLILTAASPFFETRLAENTEQNSKIPVLAIEEVEGVALEEIFNAIYTSRLRLLPENVYFILEASHFLQLEAIKNACVVWIMKNTDIHYLVDACLFAKSIEEANLYNQCVRTISWDLLRWSKTDTFKDVPLDVLNTISSRCDTAKIEEMVLLIIIKWSKYNKANPSDVQTLLDSAKLKTKIVNTLIMSELIMNAGDDMILNDKAKITTEEIEPNSNFSFYLYVNGVDVRTGVKGWGTMKINDTFEKFVMSNFCSEDSKFRKIVKIGTKHFCFEVKNHKKNTFSSFDEYYHKTVLNLPPGVVFSSFDMTAVGNVIHLLNTGDDANNSVIWTYDCATGTWKQSFECKIESQRQKPGASHTNSSTIYHQNSTTNYSVRIGLGSCKRTSVCPQRAYTMPACGQSIPRIEYETYTEIKPALHSYKSHSFLFSSNVGILYVITKTSNSQSVILSFDHLSPKASVLTYISFHHKNAAVCMFDNKIALSGSSDVDGLSNSLNIFDITAKKWLQGLEPMNYKRASHNLFYHDGFLYAVENERPLIPNEKYDLKSNVWTNIPSLPKRILVDNTNEVMIVSTCNVFGVDAHPTQL